MSSIIIHITPHDHTSHITQNIFRKKQLKSTMLQMLYFQSSLTLSPGWGNLVWRVTNVHWQAIKWQLFRHQQSSLNDLKQYYLTTFKNSKPISQRQEIDVLLSWKSTLYPDSQWYFKSINTELRQVSCVCLTKVDCRDCVIISQWLQTVCPHVPLLLLQIVFKNMASRPYSIYPHGLTIEKSQEGVNYPKGGTHFSSHLKQTF